MQALKFEGSGFEYFRIWIVNILLTIVTLTLYYPWAKVRNRRYFYANASLEGRNFEYHATGKQLFVGYLIAMAILVIYLVIQQLSPIIGLLAFGAFILGLPWIVWRGLMFNMRMTSFSNVRFGFNGQLGGAYFNYLVMPIIFFLSFYAVPIVLTVVVAALNSFSTVLAVLAALVLFVAGIFFVAYVYGRLKMYNTGYVINSIQYGQGKFATRVNAGEFAKIALKTVGLSVVATIAYMVLVAVLALVVGLGTELTELAGKMQDPEAVQDALGSSAIVALIGLIYLGFFIISILVFSYSYARQRRYIFANSRLDGEIKFVSTMHATSLAWVSITNLLMVIVSLGLAIPWAKVRMARFILQQTQVDSRSGFDDYVTQQQAAQSSLGEQIGDAFDVDVGLGI